MFYMKRCIPARCMNSTLLEGFIFLFIVLLFFILTSICLKGFPNIQIGTLNKKPEPFTLAVQTLNSRYILVNELKVSRKRKFDNENARLIGFPVRDIDINRSNDSQKIIYLATKHFNEWNSKHYYSLHFGSTTFSRYSCPINNCYVTNDPNDIQKSHAVLFHVRDLEVYSMPIYRAPEQIWIIYSMEPPWLEINDMRRFNGIFNWTMSYRRTSDVRVTYGFIGRKQRNHSETTKPLNLDNMFQKKKSKAVWYVSNCETDSNREGYIKRLRKVFPVDVFGGCGRESCRPAETKKCYTQIAGRYMFYLSFENAICQDYVTEKLFNALEYYIVPVTFGGVNYSDIVPINSIINAMDFPSPEELGHYLWKVSQNESLYLSYFAWKDTYRSYLQPWMCDLCEKLHNPISRQTRYDLDSWWNEEESCLRWSEGFSPVLRHAFPKYHAKLFV